MPKIILVRHGRSGHVQAGWMTRGEFLGWREAYEAAGIDPHDVPPAELRRAADRSQVIAASMSRRAVESAMALAPGREVLMSPLLNELELQPPNLARFSLPLWGWALTFALRWLTGDVATVAEKERASAAGRWLAELAAVHGEVIVVTHASLGSILAREFVRAGWHSDVPRRRSAHWSAWSFSRNGTTAGLPYGRGACS